jgi:dephospho-CoA kinase
MIIGIAGTFASGKGMVVEYLKTKGFTHYSSSDKLKEILSERGQTKTRHDMSSLAEELLASYPGGGILALNIERAERDGAKDLVLEAIHRPSEADFVRSKGGVIWGVDADVDIRYQRTLMRGDGEKDAVTLEQFKENMAREEEGKRELTSNIRDVINNADVVFMNNGTLEELHTQVDAALAKI